MLCGRSDSGNRSAGCRERGDDEIQTNRMKKKTCNTGHKDQ